MVSQTKSNPSGFFINSLIHVPYVVEDLTHRHTTDETKRNHRSDFVFHSTHRRSSNRE